jgi:carbon storage regulator
MLVLSRKQGEQLVIGGNVTITIVEVRGDKVRLAFDAPSDVSIHRHEVWQRIVAEEQAAQHGVLQLS